MRGVDVLVWLVAIGVYLGGWVMDIRPALRRRMLTPIPVPCDRPDCQYLDFDLIHPAGCDPVWRPRGAVRERTSDDAWVAVLVAGIWPLRLLAIVFVFAVYAVFTGADRGVSTLALGGQLTAPELERRLREQETEIARLTKEIDEGGHDD